MGPADASVTAQQETTVPPASVQHGPQELAHGRGSGRPTRLRQKVVPSSQASFQNLAIYTEQGGAKLVLSLCFSAPF